MRLVGIASLLAQPSTWPPTQRQPDDLPGSLEGRLLDPATLPELPPEPELLGVRHVAPPAVLREPTTRERRRGQAYLAKLIDELARVPAGGRNAALNKTAWKLGQWAAAAALTQGEVEDALYGAAEANGLVADDGPRQCWATICAGSAKGCCGPSTWTPRTSRPPGDVVCAVEVTGAADARNGGSAEEIAHAAQFHLYRPACAPGLLRSWAGETTAACETGCAGRLCHVRDIGRSARMPNSWPTLPSA